MDEGSYARPDVRPLGAVPPAAAQTLWSVQVMRGLAALMVVIGHSQSAVGGVVAASGGTFARSTIVPWGAGVDLFFVISGFIMVHASRTLFARPGARAEFLRRRLVRVVPLYWLVTTLFLLLLSAAALKGGDALPGVGVTLASYAFLPMDTLGDGQLFPIYDLGWTLNYEMFFYALLALVVAWPRGRALSYLAVMLVALVVVGSWVPTGSALWFWTRPILMDFGLGLAIGALLARGVVLPGAARLALVGAGLIALLLDPLHVFDGRAGETVANAWPRVFAAGVPVTAVLAGAVLGREPAMPRLARPFGRLGDASYSLYLFHPFALIVMEKLAQKLAPVRDAPGWLLVIATIAAAVALGFVAYRWIERPITVAAARRTLSDRRSSHVPASSPPEPSRRAAQPLQRRARAGSDLS
ncbi:acyltransferase family protein [Sphingomonas radiodurans]|uniref:acyltransferase family protein n=1 Tax=Sphingomonas radiodurans TaxID=2890321 RepID=UPI001E4BAE1D|nr:acyltransferase [Sphingomonas radiodurans]WBH18079.1 acyltransferase [Sphingomonas radiodurans]